MLNVRIQLSLFREKMSSIFFKLLKNYNMRGAYTDVKIKTTDLNKEWI